MSAITYSPARRITSVRNCADLTRSFCLGRGMSRFDACQVARLAAAMMRSGLSQGAAYRTATAVAENALASTSQAVALAQAA